MTEALTPVEVFCCYSHADEACLQKLEIHLSLLQRQGLISLWHDQQILAGSDRTSTINKHFQDASIILLLVSPDFLASDYCFSIEMQRALERHHAGQTYIIPILLRPVDWQGTPFVDLQWLPKSVKPVTTWPNLDEAFLDVAKGIHKVIDEVNAKHAGSSRAIEAQVLPPSIREKILKILYEERSALSPTFDGEDLAHLIGKRWYEIRSDVAYLEEKGYIVAKQSHIRTRIFHRLGITTAGIDFFESEMQHFL